MATEIQDTLNQLGREVDVLVQRAETQMNIIEGLREKNKNQYEALRDMRSKNRAVTERPFLSPPHYERPGAAAKSLDTELKLAAFRRSRDAWKRIAEARERTYEELAREKDKLAADLRTATASRDYWQDLAKCQITSAGALSREREALSAKLSAIGGALRGE